MVSGGSLSRKSLTDGSLSRGRSLSRGVSVRGAGPCPRGLPDTSGVSGTETPPDRDPRTVTSGWYACFLVASASETANDGFNV